MSRTPEGTTSADWRWRHKVECRNAKAPQFFNINCVISEALPGSMRATGTLWSLARRCETTANEPAWVARENLGSRTLIVPERQLMHDKRAMSCRPPLHMLKLNCQAQGRPLPEGCKSL